MRQHVQAQAFHLANESKKKKNWGKLCTHELLMNLLLKWRRICRLNPSDGESSRWYRLPDAHLHRNFSWKLATAGLLCSKYRPHIQVSQSQVRLQQTPLGKIMFCLGELRIWETEKKIQCSGIHQNSSMNRRKKKDIWKSLLQMI